MDYEVTGDEFHEILERFIEKKISISELLSMPDIYEILSEKYNNEILDIWEQKKDQMGQEENELFSFVLHERQGEREFMHERLVIAKNIEAAENKAINYAGRWYPFDSTHQFIKHKKLHIFDSGTCYVTVAGIGKVDKKDWMLMMYRAALVG